MIKTRHSPLLVLLLLWIVFAVLLVVTYGQWPALVATHFDLGGNPDRWMDRAWNSVAYAALGIGMPLVIYGGFSLASVLPAQFVNLPRREYWLAPERRAETLGELRRQSLWFGSLILLFVAGLYVITLDANQQQPAKLSTTAVLILLAGFLLGVAIWVASLFRRFWKTE